ncbi:MAG TPA: universal stress protein [Candidatus Polarisedimenticolia bacterium]|nr:universal stress protein [Candidatus Polarisedimenticolia bacterium]
MRILLAYDASPSSEAAVDEVVRRPWPPGSEVRLVTVVERPLPVPPPNGVEVYAPLVERMRASLREEAYQRLQGALQKLAPRTDLNASYEIRDGSVKHALLDAIREWKADLVVAGSHGASGLARLFLGSVCHALVTSAPCHVEVIKLREGKEGAATA